MPKISFEGLIGIISNLSGTWKAIGIGLAGAALILSVGGGVKAGLQVPAKLDAHMAQTDSTNALLRQVIHQLKTSNCLQVAQLRRIDWTSCLLPVTQ